MRLEHALDDLLATRSHVRVLRGLDELPDGLAVSARDLARRSGLSHPTVSKVLASLTSQGVVLVRRAPGTGAFELNRRHVLVEKVRPLFEWERQLPRELLIFLGREIERAAPGVSAAHLFGSAARGQMTSASDVDLAVIVLNPNDVSETEAALARVADTVRGRFGNRLDVTIGSSPIEQLRRPGRQSYRLWATVAREGIAVIDPGKSTETQARKMRSGHT